jgi:hypothetical protein
VVGHTGAQPSRITDSFAGPDGLIARGNPPVASSTWEMDSGSLFRSNGVGWSGVPDAGDAPDQTGSAVFRLVSVARDFADVDISLSLRIDDLVETHSTPAVIWDGADVWVHYQSEYQLYYVSVDRRDGAMVIKKKCQGGPNPSNGGTYYNLIREIHDRPIPFGQWQHVAVSVRDLPDGSVAITGNRDGFQIQAVDTGIGCAPLRGGGGVGIRGDNAELRLDDIVVDPIQ